MKRKLLLAAGLVILTAGSAYAQQSVDLPPVTDATPVYGAQMMTQQEMLEHRERMRAAKTLEERERIRAEHHQRMVIRARERGVTLPEEMPPRGGMGPGMGPGWGGGRGAQPR